MTSLEKTIDLLHRMPERQIERMYDYALFLSGHETGRGKKSLEELDRILDGLTGIVPDTGKSLDDYREERLRERYGDFG